MPASAVSASRRLRVSDFVVAALMLAGLAHLRAGDGAPTRRLAPTADASAAAGQPEGAAGASAAPLVTEVAPPGYPEGSPERTVFDALNEARRSGNFGLLAQDTRLDAAAVAHAQYLARNLGGEISHYQDSRQPGYTGETPRDRIRATGYETAVSYEAISSGTTARACLELLNTVYHLESLMIGATDVGIAVHADAGCVIEPQLPHLRARMQMRRAGSVGVYPYPGQAGVPAAFMPATETPNPAPDLGHAVIGPPILVDLDSDASPGLAASDVVLERFELHEASSGKPVTARVLAARTVLAGPGAGLSLQVDRRLVSAGHVFLLPLQPLAPATTYAVAFSGSVKGVPVSRQWGFTTR